MAKFWPWRRKDEGFEWHKYVRTTIALRREHRREKAEEIKRSVEDGAIRAAENAAKLGRKGARAASDGARRASVSAGHGFKSAMAASGRGLANAAAASGRGIASAASATGRGLARFAAASGRGSRQFLSASGRGLRVGSRATWSGAGTAGRGFVAGSVAGLAWLGASLGKGMGAAGRATGGGLGQASRPLLDVLGRPGVSGPLLLAGSVALLSAIVRLFLTGGIDRAAVISAVIGGVLLLAGLAPRLQFGGGAAVFDALAAPFRGLAQRTRQIAGGGAVVALAVAATIWMLPGTVSLPQMSLSSFVPFMASEPPITGRAGIVSGDMLRVDRTTIRLDGIEALDRGQTCARAGNRQWRCGDAAQAALARLIGGRQVRCEPSGKDSAGIVRATCFVGTSDIAAALVKGGHVLAESGMMSRYRAEQAAAREEKAGVWKGAGEPERPAAWRSRVWEEARARAPQGCPIKGKVSGRRGDGVKTYHLPWSPSYMQLRVVSSRGERWFCSEDEARAAGFTPPEIDG